MHHPILKARVTITTVAPLSIAMPVAEFTQPNQWGNFPVMTRGVDEDGNPKKTGYLPATTVRGAMRRGIVVPEMVKASEAGKPYTLPKAYAELIGQDAQSELQPDEIDLVQIQKHRDESPVIDLFGSGLGVKSRLRVSHFVPKTNILPEVFTAVRKDVGDTEGTLEALSSEDREAYLRRQKAGSKRSQAERLLTQLKRSKRQGKDVPEDIDKQIEEAEKLAAKYEEDMTDMKVSSRSIMQHYALPAGLELYGRLIVENYKDRDLDMIIAGFDAISKWPILGANSARGCGEVSGTADIEVNGGLTKTIAFGGFEPIVLTDF